MELQGLADRAGTRFPNEEIRQGHEILDVRSKSLDEHGLFGPQLLELPGGRLGLSPEQNQLPPGRVFIEAAGDIQHDARAVAAEQNDPRWTIGIESVPLPFASPVYRVRLVKVGLEHHPRGAKDALARMTHG